MDWKEESQKLNKRISKLLKDSPFSKEIIIDKIREHKFK